jgi:ribose transport system permease protein
MEGRTMGKGISQENIERENWFLAFFRRPDSSAIIALVALVVVFAIGTESFLTGQNIFNVLRNSSLYIFIALGQALPLIVGGMNISLGAVGGLSTITIGITFQIFHLPTPAVILITLLVGCLCGAINGLIIVKIKINSFVTTLATSFVFTGLVYGISKGFPYADIPSTFTTVGRGSLFGIPYLFYLAVLTLVILFVFFNYVTLGRKILVTGGNKEAAQLSGVKTDGIIILANVMSCAFSSLAAIAWVSRMGTAPPSIGSDWMLISFAVAIIGGTALTGGLFSASGFLCAGVMFALIKNGLVMMKVNIYYEQTFLGLVILLAVAIESVRYGYASKGAKLRRGK